MLGVRGSGFETHDVWLIGRIDIQQIRFGIEARTAPIGSSVKAWNNHRSFHAGRVVSGAASQRCQLLQHELAIGGSNVGDIALIKMLSRESRRSSGHG